MFFRTSPVFGYDAPVIEPQPPRGGNGAAAPERPRTAGSPRPPPVRVSVVADPPRSTSPKRPPFEGLGPAAAKIGAVLLRVLAALVSVLGALARGLGILARGVGRLSTLVYGRLRARSETAVVTFQKRRKHSRYRVYAVSVYCLLAGATLAFQLYSQNSIDAYVRVERVDFPRNASTVFIRNESKMPWNDLRVVLNGIWIYERPRLDPNDHMMVRVDRFGLVDPKTGKMSFPPADIVAHRLTISCDRGSFESELQ